MLVEELNDGYCEIGSPNSLLVNGLSSPSLFTDDDDNDDVDDDEDDGDEPSRSILQQDVMEDEEPEDYGSQYEGRDFDIRHLSKYRIIN